MGGRAAIHNNGIIHEMLRQVQYSISEVRSVHHQPRLPDNPKSGSPVTPSENEIIGTVGFACADRIEFYVKEND